MKIKKSNISLKAKVITLLVVITLLTAGAIYYFSRQTHQSENVGRQNTDKSSDKKSPENRTYTQQTEGKDVTVPDNVPSSSIKNYALITDNETYKIRELDGEYYITLYAIINRPDQADTYRDQLRQYKQDALQYLKEKNIDTNKVKINYEPAEAASL